MALIADDAADRVGQLLIVTERLTELVAEETRLIAAREPLPEGPVAEEKARLANAYRFELARIKQDKALIEGAPAPLLDDLRAKTAALNQALGAHEIELTAVKLITEGLVQAMAEELSRLRAQARGYGATGGVNAGATPSPVVVDRTT